MFARRLVYHLLHYCIYTGIFCNRRAMCVFRILFCYRLLFPFVSVYGRTKSFLPSCACDSLCPFTHLLGHSSCNEDNDRSGSDCLDGLELNEGKVCERTGPFQTPYFACDHLLPYLVPVCVCVWSCDSCPFLKPCRR